MSQRTDTIRDLSFQKYLFTVCIWSQIFFEHLLGARPWGHSSEDQTARPPPKR